MTETRQCIGFGDVERFLVRSYNCITGGREFDIEKYEPYVDAVRHVLAPSLEKQVLFCLERFVYKEDFQQSSCQPYLDRYKESMLTAYEKYNEIGNSIEGMRDLLTIDHVVNFLASSLLTSSRLNKLARDLDALGIEKNWLGHVNVLNYVNEKDFWLCSPSSSNTSRQYNSLCSPGNDNILSDVITDRGCLVAERVRGHKRPRKRGATHISGKHYKLERLAHLSDGSFKVTESLYDLLKSNWALRNSVYTKRRLKRSCCDLRRSSFTKDPKKQTKTDWKKGNLTLVIRKVDGSAIPRVDENEDTLKNLMVRSALTLPCKVEQFLSKLDAVDPSLTRFHCRLIKKRFRTKLYNVCSCLNNLLSKMDVKAISSIYLICEIRKDYLNLKLRPSLVSKCNSILFSARVMTCQALYRYGIENTGARQKLKSQSFLATKQSNETAISQCGLGAANTECCDENVNFPEDQVISSIEITFEGCEENGVDQQIEPTTIFTCDLKNFEDATLRDSLSISDVVQKLELSPFRLQETEQSFRIRSKIRDIVRSIMMCTQKNSSNGRGTMRSISIQAIVSTTSLPAIKKEVVPPTSRRSSKASSVSKIVSFIESKIFPQKSEKNFNRKEFAQRENRRKLNGSGKLKKSPAPRSFLAAREQESESRGSSRPSKSLKSQQPSSCEEYARLKDKNNSKICTISDKSPLPKEFIRPHRRPLSKKMVESIASEISDALARSKCSPSDYDIAVTVQIEDSSPSSDDDTDSISRHTHILPSMRSVRLGTNPKCFPQDWSKSTASSSSWSSSSSKNEIPKCDNFTTMNKSMLSSSHRGTISTKSYDRIRHIIREKVSKKLSETDSCQPKSSKTVVSSGKYYLSIPSSKTSRVLLRNEISESSSTSGDVPQLPVSKRRGGRRRAPTRTSLPSTRESASSKSSPCYFSDSTDSAQSSRAANFDKNSIYGCIDDRLANRYFAEIIDDYSDEAGDSPRYNDEDVRKHHGGYSGQSNDCEIFSNEKREDADRFYDFQVHKEGNENSFDQDFATDDEAGESDSPSNDVVEGLSQRYSKLKFPERFEKIDRTRRASGWSTRTIRPTNSRECPVIYSPRCNNRSKIRDRGDSWQQRPSGPFGIIEKYKKRFQNIDKNLRAKLVRYVELCRNAKTNFQKQICFEDIHEASRTSIPSSDLRKYKYRR